MRTYSQTSEEAASSRKWLVVDAADKPLGRVASEIAALIRGKHKPEFTPHIDCGDYVIVLNAARVALTGRKKTNKFYYRHSGYVGGIKRISAGKLLQTYPERVIEKAVKGMLPRGALGHQMIKKLKVYAGEKHPHSAQKPEEYKLQYV